MKQYKSFVFGSFDFDPDSGRIALRYALDDEIHFEEIIEIPAEGGLKLNAMHQALLALHVAAGTSYFKTCCPKTMEIRSGVLNNDQAAFWNTVYENGLGEFFFRNQIDFRGLIRFPATDPGTPVFHQSDRSPSKRILVPVGGGKDSIVTIEKLKAQKKDITLLRIGSHPLIDELVRITGLPCITVKRRLPAELFALNEQGALNGHVPITGLLSCLAVVIAEAAGFDTVVMSNEKSANEGNVEYLGKTINHQWSKSAEFADAFNRYIQTYVNKNLRYENALGDMTELEVVREFVKYPQYFQSFTSCNANWKITRGQEKRDMRLETNRWCGKCPKCAFVFALLAAYLPKAEVLKIFGRNLFDDTSLLPLYRQLLGIEGFKPFECVGTPEETKQACAMTKTRGEFAQAAILKVLKY
ncbi:endonuclease domain-containing protein [Candidatus Peregrinibacteria bacterium]|nr:endonuclease domain-containing protein [Candidatus Peregrinibacteria bacterium]